MLRAADLWAASHPADQFVEGNTTPDFDQEWDLPGGLALPGETLASALDRTLACGYGLDIVEIPRYLGSHDRIDHGETTRTFVFTATCADPLQICQHAQVAHCWADSASLPDQISQISSAWPTSPCRQPQAGPATRPAPPVADNHGAPRLQQGNVLPGSRHRTDHQPRILAAQRRLHHQFILTLAGSAGGITAVIDWEEALTALRAGDLPCSSSEAASLQLAASLATSSPVILRHAITGLDHTNLHLVINAIRRAGGQN